MFDCTAVVNAVNMAKVLMKFGTDVDDETMAMLQGEVDLFMTQLGSRA